jgi:hypothetical protein
LHDLEPSGSGREGDDLEEPRALQPLKFQKAGRSFDALVFGCGADPQRIHAGEPATV